MFARLIPCVAAAALLGLAGCGPAVLDQRVNWVIDPGETPARALDLDAQPKPQTLTVEYESSAAEVEVGVYKAADAKELETVQTSKALKAESGKKSGSLTVDIPEKTAVRVVVGGSRKKTDVKLHVTNKK